MRNVPVLSVWPYAHSLAGSMSEVGSYPSGGLIWMNAQAKGLPSWSRTVPEMLAVATRTGRTMSMSSRLSSSPRATSVAWSGEAASTYHRCTYSQPLSAAADTMYVPAGSCSTA